MKSSNKRYVIISLLVNFKKRTDFKDVRVRRGAEMCSDHYLLRARMRKRSRRERKSMYVGREKRQMNISI